MTSAEFWVKVKEHFLKQDGVMKQGESLKIKKKMFAMFNKGRFIVKLPKERVAALLDSKEGQPYDPGTGTIMKEWIIIPEQHSDKWIDYTQEAKTYAEKIAK